MARMSLPIFTLKQQGDRVMFDTIINSLLGPELEKAGGAVSPQGETPNQQEQMLAALNFGGAQTPPMFPPQNANTQSAALPPPAMLPPSDATAVSNPEAGPPGRHIPRGIIPPRVRAGIFAGESGGDYDALFGFSNRPGGKFENVKLTDMTVNEALAFANPRGAYGQWVKPQNKGDVATPMGAYQVVGSTLKAARDGLGLTGNEKMTPELQDRIGDWIYQNQGIKAWAGYKGERDPSDITMSARAAGEGFPQRGNGPIDFSDSPLFKDTEPEVDPKKERRARLIAGLDAFSRGLGQISQGQPVDISDVFEMHRQRQIEARNRLKEINEAQRTRESRERLLQQVAAYDPELAQLGASGEEGFAQMQEIMRQRQQQQIAQENAVFNENLQRETAVLNDERGQRITQENALFNDALRRSEIRETEAAKAAKDNVIINGIADAFDSAGLSQQAEAIRRSGSADIAESMMNSYGNKSISIDMEALQAKAAREQDRLVYSELYGDDIGRIAQMLGPDAADKIVARNQQRELSNNTAMDVLSIGEVLNDDTFRMIGTIMAAGDGMSVQDAMKIFEAANPDTADLKNFEAMMKMPAGEREDFINFLKTKGMNINLGDQAEVIRLKSGYEELARNRKDIEDAMPAYRTLSALSDMLLPDENGNILVPTGVFEEALLPVKEIMGQMGLLTDSQISEVGMQKVVAQLRFRLVPTVREPGQTSNFELEQYLKAVPGLGNSPVANALMLQQLIADVEEQQNYIQAKEDWLSNNKSLNGFERYYNEERANGKARIGFGNMSSQKSAERVMKSLANGGMRVGDLVADVDKNGKPIVRQLDATDLQIAKEMFGE